MRTEIIQIPSTIQRLKVEIIFVILWDNEIDEYDNDVRFTTDSGKYGKVLGQFGQTSHALHVPLYLHSLL